MLWLGQLSVTAAFLVLVATGAPVALATSDDGSVDDRSLRFRTTATTTTTTTTTTRNTSCTGYFCNKRLDEIFIVGTHNSLALPGQVLSPNQKYGLATQFVDGIRFFNLDLYYDDKDGTVVTRHGPGLVYDPSDQMKELVTAMTTTPDNEFVLIQVQDAVRDTEKIHQFLEDTGFSSRLVKNFDISKTLGDYIQQGQDVLLVTNAAASTNASLGIHSTYELVTENDYIWKSCYFDAAPMTYRRGPVSAQSDRSSFKLMNYFCSLTGTGDIIASDNVNQKHRILYSAREFIQQDYTGGIINGILVDYYQKGNVWEVQAQARSSGYDWSDNDCWEDGRTCGQGTTCWYCCRDAEWWDQKFFTACGPEPCWSRGALCGKGTTCDNCCGGSTSCPWWSFGVCRCK
eukprot:scaffold34631_cov251-Amphora_coffeaeformis.AAC.7